MGVGGTGTVSEAPTAPASQTPGSRASPAPRVQSRVKGSQNGRGLRRPSLVQEAGGIIPRTSCRDKTCQPLAVGAHRPDLLLGYKVATEVLAAACPLQVRQSTLVCKAVGEPGLW